MINLFAPYVPKDVREAVYDALGEKNLTQGPKVDAFEKEFCKKFRLASALTVNSGTAALELAYDLIGLKAGDEVITTPFTCTATNIPLIRRGVKLVWADIQKHSLCIDPKDVQNKVTNRTKAVVQVHVGGIRADVGKVVDDDQGVPRYVPVVSDAAQALGVFNGDITCCSFQAIKHITTIDGGMICCNNADQSEQAKLLRWFGIDRNKKMPNTPLQYRDRKMTYDIEVPGYKMHMNDVNATMGLVGLAHYDEMMAHRKRLFRIYSEELQHLDGIQLVDGIDRSSGIPFSHQDFQNTYWLATVLVERRDDFAKMLFESDIDCHIVQARNDTYKIFGGERADLPVMNEIEGKYLSIPIGMHVSEEEVHYICNQIKGGW